MTYAGWASHILSYTNCALSYRGQTKCFSLSVLLQRLAGSWWNIPVKMARTKQIYDLQRHTWRARAVEWYMSRSIHVYRMMLNDGRAHLWSLNDEKFLPGEIWKVIIFEGNWNTLHTFRVPESSMRQNGCQRRWHIKLKNMNNDEKAHIPNITRSELRILWDL